MTKTKIVSALLFSASLFAQTTNPELSALKKELGPEFDRLRGSGTALNDLEFRALSAPGRINAWSLFANIMTSSTP